MARNALLILWTLLNGYGLGGAAAQQQPKQQQQQPSSSQQGTPCKQLANPSDYSLQTDFSNATSAWRLMPTGGACYVFSYVVTTPCDQPNSTLLFELWLTNQNANPLDRRRTVDGIYVGAAKDTPPTFITTPSGSVTYSPLAVFGTDPNLIYMYTDTDATNNHRTYHRFTVPVGSFFNHFNVAQQNWFLTVANTNMQLATSSLGFSMRATCMLSAQLPCARTAPDAGQCNTPWPPTGGVCQDPGNTGSKACICNSSFVDSACGSPVTDLSTNTQFSAIDVSPFTWSYYSVTVQNAADTLVELTKPPLAANTYYLVLLVESYPPGYLDINQAQAYSLTDSCTCSTCNCYVPQQSQDLLYEQVQLAQTASFPYTWYIGVYNYQPHATSITGAAPTPPSTPGVMLRARTSGTMTNSGGPLCPLDCSGSGQCGYPTANQQYPSTYVCYCNPGYGGAYCQGSSQSIRVSNNGGGFDAGHPSLAPGAWSFFTLTSVTSNVVTLTWSPDQSPSPNLFFVFSPIYSWSVGEQFFVPAASWVFNFSTAMQIPSGGSPNGWIMGVFNSDAQAQTTSSFNLAISNPAHFQQLPQSFLAATCQPPKQAQSASPFNLAISNPSKYYAFLSTLQMALIGAASGLIMLTLCFMAVRMLLIRRATAMRTFPEAAMGPDGTEMTTQQEGRSAPVGVPAEVVNTFPLFKFHAATFDTTRKQAAQASLTRAQAATTAAAAAAAAAAAEPKRAGAAEGGAAAAAGSGSGCGAAAPAADGHEHDEDDDEGDADGPQCSVCICDFEEGEVLRQLPCRHVFHASCIDPWMTQHNTCPNCRWHLCPDAAPQDARRHRRRPRNQVFPEAGAAAPSTLDPAGAAPRRPSAATPTDPADAASAGLRSAAALAGPSEQQQQPPPSRGGAAGAAAAAPPPASPLRPPSSGVTVLALGRPGAPSSARGGRASYSSPSGGPGAGDARWSGRRSGGDGGHTRGTLRSDPVPDVQ